MQSMRIERNKQKQYKEQTMDRDREELLEELRTYYGTAAVNGFEMAAMDLYALDSMDDEELEELTEELGL